METLNVKAQSPHRRNMLSVENVKNAPASLELASAIIVGIATAAILALVVVHAYSGFDFTDEGYYLLSIAAPYRYYNATVTAFGFVYHPLYELVRGDIGSLRAISYAFTFVLSCMTSGALFCRFFKPLHATRSGLLVSLPGLAAIASSSLVVSSFELAQSPSYNTLLWQTMLLGIGGLVLINDGWPRLGTIGSILFGISCALAAINKPPAAVAFMFIGLLCLLAQSQLSLARIALMAGAGSIALVLLVWAIDGSAQALYVRLNDGLALIHLLGGGQLSWPQESLFPLSSVELLLLLAMSLAFGAIIILSALGNGMTRKVGVACSMILGVAAIIISVGAFPLKSPLGRYDGVFVLVYPISGLIALLVGNRLRFVTRNHLAFFLLLILVPHAYAFGTGRPHWLNAQAASLSWILFGMIAVSLLQDKVSSAPWRVLLPVGSGAIFVAALFIFASVEYPMRQPQPLWLNTDTVEIGERGSQLFLSEDFAEYVRGLRRLARAGNFEAGTPIIDLTGYSPGAVFLMNGVSIVVPWFAGGYVGSDAFAGAALDLASCADIARAWILTEPAGPDQISTSVLERFGIEADRDYLSLGVVWTPLQPLGKSFEQQLLKPRRVLKDAQRACELKRREHAVTN